MFITLLDNHMECPKFQKKKSGNQKSNNLLYCKLSDTHIISHLVFNQDLWRFISITHNFQKTYKGSNTLNQSTSQPFLCAVNSVFVYPKVATVGNGFHSWIKTLVNTSRVVSFLRDLDTTATTAVRAPAKVVFAYCTIAMHFGASTGHLSKSAFEVI